MNLGDKRAEGCSKEGASGGVASGDKDQMAAKYIF
jgi:hypothetical protein